MKTIFEDEEEDYEIVTVCEDEIEEESAKKTTGEFMLQKNRKRGKKRKWVCFNDSTILFFSPSALNLNVFHLLCIRIVIRCQSIYKLSKPWFLGKGTRINFRILLLLFSRMPTKTILGWDKTAWRRKEIARPKKTKVNVSYQANEFSSYFISSISSCFANNSFSSSSF